MLSVARPVAISVARMVAMSVARLVAMSVARQVAKWVDERAGYTRHHAIGSNTCVHLTNVVSCGRS